MDKPKIISFRPSESDLIALNQIGEKIHSSSLSATLHYAIQETFKHLDEPDLSNLKSAPIGAKHFPAPLPVIDSDTREIEDPSSPALLYKYMRRGWDEEAGEEFIVIKETTKPFREKGIKEGDPLWELFKDNK